MLTSLNAGNQCSMSQNRSAKDPYSPLFTISSMKKEGEITDPRIANNVPKRVNFFFLPVEFGVTLTLFLIGDRPTVS